MPKVTILTTLYNKGAFIQQAIQSVLHQTFVDFELLIVDDHSTDDGLEKAARCGDRRIRILTSSKNTGRAAAANRGYDAATGEYIAVLDADDVMHPQRLAKQVAYLNSHPEVGVVGAWLNTFGAADRMLRFPERDMECRALELFGMPVMYGSCMLRHSVLEQFNIRCDPNWLLPGMDRLLMLDVGRHAAYANLPEVLTSYRIGVQNMRHGRDSLADRILLDMEVLRRMGYPHGRKQAELHLYLQSDNDLVPRSCHETWSLHRWIHTLVRLNREQRTMDPQAFEKEINTRWQRLFHGISQQTAGGALFHMLTSGTLQEQFRHWAKITKDRWVNK